MLWNLDTAPMLHTTNEAVPPNVVLKEVDIPSLQPRSVDPAPLGNQQDQVVQEEPPPILVSVGLTDPTRPDNWPARSKHLVLAAGILSDLSSTLGSSLPSNCITYIAAEWNVKSEVQQALPISIYITGFIIGPALYGPLSETYGRKPILLIPFIGYVAFTLGCALARSWTSFLIFRFLCGAMASAPIAIVGGLFADVYSDERIRGRHLTYFIAVSGFGPCLGPPLSGFIAENTSWRWTFWVALILAAITLPLIIAMPETYLPVLLRRKAARLRLTTGNDNFTTHSIADVRKPFDIVTVVLTRPFKMLATEAVVFFSCIYLALIYGVFYMTFQFWPLAFSGVYGMSPGIAGLAWIPFGVGTFFAVGIAFLYDDFLVRAQETARSSSSSTTTEEGAEEEAELQSWPFKPEFRRLPLACLGGPLWALSLFWLGWCVHPSIHWSAAMASGITLGTGYLLIFIAILNYLGDSYTIYSASVQSISSTTRSLFGAFLPLLTPHMYGRLGFRWACSVLGFVSLVMVVIPFGFICFGERLRAKSAFRTELGDRRAMELETGTTILTEPPASHGARRSVDAS